MLLMLLMPMLLRLHALAHGRRYAVGEGLRGPDETARDDEADEGPFGKPGPPAAMLGADLAIKGAAVPRVGESHDGRPPRRLSLTDMLVKGPSSRLIFFSNDKTFAR